jgi:hypothetical protein
MKIFIVFLLTLGFLQADWWSNTKTWSKKAYNDTKVFSKEAGKDIAEFSKEAGKDIAEFSAKSYKATKKYIKAHPKEVAIGTVVVLTAVDIATGGTTLGLTAPIVTSSLATLGGGSMVTGLATIGVTGLTAGYLLGKDSAEKNTTAP